MPYYSTGCILSNGPNDNDHRKIAKRTISPGISYPSPLIIVQPVFIFQNLIKRIEVKRDNYLYWNDQMKIYEQQNVSFL